MQAEKNQAAMTSKMNAFEEKIMRVVVGAAVFVAVVVVVIAAAFLRRL